MLSISRPLTIRISHWLLLCLLCFSLPLPALETDRQKSLEVSADSTDGTLGDGVTTLRGNVDIRQGTLHITADEAEVKKIDGKVGSVTFRGVPASLEQEIEEQGLVQATANVIDYQVASGIVTLTGNADVKHPQYQISGEILTYDLTKQHFQGNGDKSSSNGRIHILMDPEVVNNDVNFKGKKDDIESKPELADPPTKTVDPDGSAKDNN